MNSGVRSKHTIAANSVARCSAEHHTRNPPSDYRANHEAKPTLFRTETLLTLGAGSDLSFNHRSACKSRSLPSRAGNLIFKTWSVSQNPYAKPEIAFYRVRCLKPPTTGFVVSIYLTAIPSIVADRYNRIYSIDISNGNRL